MAQEQMDTPRMAMGVRIFLSHSERDKALVLPLRDWLKTGLGLDDLEIRCTSVENMPAGSLPAEALRRDLLAADAVVGLLTRNSLDSYWVQLEVGAAWVRDRLHPVCGPDLSTKDLPSPHCDITTADYSANGSMRSLLRNLARILDTPVRPEADEELKKMTEAAKAWRAQVALCWLQLPPALSACRISNCGNSGESVNVKLRSLCESLDLSVPEVQGWVNRQGTVVNDPVDIPHWAEPYWAISRNAVNFMTCDDKAKAQRSIDVPQNVLSPSLEGRLISALDSPTDSIAMMRDWFADALEWVRAHPPQPNAGHGVTGHRAH